MKRYVMARTRAKRPTLQHKVSFGHITKCGIEMLGWSRVYQNDPIPILLCRRCEPVHVRV